MRFPLCLCPLHLLLCSNDLRGVFVDVRLRVSVKVQFIAEYEDGLFAIPDCRADEYSSHCRSGRPMAI